MHPWSPPSSAGRTRRRESWESCRLCPQGESERERERGKEGRKRRGDVIGLSLSNV